MYYKRNNKRLSVSGRGDYMSTSDFIIQYYTNLDACRKFFYDIKWPTGYYCEKCGCTHYYFMKTKNCYRCANCKHDERLLSNTIFQDNKLPLNVLLYGLFLIFTANNGISSMELSKELKVNYKTACLLQTKARILMKNSDSKRFLDSDFYESDVAYTGAPSHNGKRGLGTDKQPFLIVLSTEQENQYPRFVKMQEVTTDSSNIIKGYFEKYVKMSKERKLNTDCKTTYNILKNRIEVNNEVIDYDNDNHRLYFLNKIISNLNSQFIDR
ncbi:MAG: transposase [Holdemanella porci]